MKKQNFKLRNCDYSQCNKEYKQYNSLVRHCSGKCKAKDSEQKIKYFLNFKGEKIEIDPPTKFKEKTLGELEIEAKEVFQKFIRLRDAFLNCISCDTSKSLIWNASHFFKCELFSGLIFDERNAHKSCQHCNVDLDGNLKEYRKGLIARFGIDYVEKLEAEANAKRVYKFTKGELIAIKLKYQIKIKELLKNG